MNLSLSISQHEVHLWRVSLAELISQEEYLLSLLNIEERQRAHRFRFILHRKRFVIARATLRNILSLYLSIPPAEIVFSYTQRGKPVLQNGELSLQFNVSHSDDVAVYAITKLASIGVDIEKVDTSYDDGVARRFFSADEYLFLTQVPASQRRVAFYQTWVRKEAVIKTLGEGLFMPLADFSVCLKNNIELLNVNYEQRMYQLHIESFTAYPHYQAAFATNQKVEHYTYWQWTQAGSEQWN